MYSVPTGNRERERERGTAITVRAKWTTYSFAESDSVAWADGDKRHQTEKKMSPKARKKRTIECEIEKEGVRMKTDEQNRWTKDAENSKMFAFCCRFTSA